MIQLLLFLFLLSVVFTFRRSVEYDRTVITFSLFLAKVRIINDSNGMDFNIYLGWPWRTK